MEMIDFRRINGVPTRSALSKGNGPFVVFIHELGGSLNSYDLLQAEIGAINPTLRYDLRGAGMSGKVSGTLDCNELCDDLAALLDAHGIDTPVILVGAAVGAAIACRFATRHAGRIAGLVLAAPALRVPAERRDAGYALADRLDAGGMKAIAETVIPRSFPEDLWDSKPARETAIARWLGADPHGYAAAYRMLIGLDLSADLPKIAVPTLVLAGQFDPHAPIDGLKDFTKALPDRQFEVLEGGHFMCVQSPGVVAPAIRAFLEAQA